MMSIGVRRPRLSRQMAICEDSFEDPSAIRPHITEASPYKTETSNGCSTEAKAPTPVRKDPPTRTDTVIRLDSIILTEKRNGN